MIAAARSLATYLIVSLYVLVAAPIGMLLAVLFRWKNLLYILGHGGVKLGLGLSGIKFRVLGENLATTRGYINPVAACLRGWMDSPGHRRNILERDFDETAIGVWIGSNGTAYFTEIFIAR